MENAVERSPENVDCWAELVFALSVDSKPYFADRASREALRLHPNNPKLLVARARILERGAALDVLAELEKLPGHAEEAWRLKEVVALGFRIPEPPSLLWGTPELVDRLAYAEKLDRAAEVVEEGLTKTPDSPQLLARKAMILALAGRFDEALDLQSRSGYQQIDWAKQCEGLGECLLSKARPELAVKSFGKTDPSDVEHRRILAWACTQTKDFARAEKLLEPAEPTGRAAAGRGGPIGVHGPQDDLLALRVLLLEGKDAQAKQLGAKIVEPLREIGSWNTIVTTMHSEPPVLKNEYARAVDWLIEQFPEKKNAIEGGFRVFGLPARIGQTYTYDPVPNSQLMSRLRERLKEPLAVGATRGEERRLFARALEEEHRFAEAAEVIVPDVLFDVLFAAAAPPDGRSSRLGSEGVLWGTLVRRADTEALFQKDPQALVKARRLLANVVGRRWNHPRVAGREWLGDKEVVEGLAALGPGVLSCVIDALEPNTISGADRTPFVEVIKRIGGPEDAPVLIETLTLVTNPRPGRDARSVAGDDASRQAIVECLEKLAGQKGADWTQWWAENAAKVLASRSARHYARAKQGEAKLICVQELLPTVHCLLSEEHAMTWKRLRASAAGIVVSVLALLLVTPAFAADAPKEAAKKKVVFIAGTRSHGFAQHAHFAGCTLLAKMLNENVPGLTAVVYRDGWPKDPTALDNADAVVIYADGGDGMPAIPHIDQLDKLMKRGVGLALLHYAVEVPKGKPGNSLLDWIGGYFEVDWSVNPVWTAEFKTLPDHPIARGVKPFTIHDEWYYHMRFRENMQGVTPILAAVPPESTRGPDGPRTGNPDVRAGRGWPRPWPGPTSGRTAGGASASPAATTTSIGATRTSARSCSTPSSGSPA